MVLILTSNYINLQWRLECSNQCNDPYNVITEHKQSSWSPVSPYSSNSSTNFSCPSKVVLSITFTTKRIICKLHWKTNQTNVWGGHACFETSTVVLHNIPQECMRVLHGLQSIKIWFNSWTCHGPTR